MMRCLLVGSLLAIAACVGDSTPPPSDGGEDGAVDVTTNDVAVDQQATDGGADVTASDAPSDAPSDVVDAAPACDAGINSSFTCASGTPVGCYDFTTTQHMCVASSNACLNSSYTTPI